MPGISIKNESQVDLLAVLSQLSPLHWNDKPIKPGETKKLSSGRVWFTLSVNAFNTKLKPTMVGVAGRLSLVTGATLFFGISGLAVTGIASGVTSTIAKTTKNDNTPGMTFKSKGFKCLGVYADNRTYVVKGFQRPDNGAYELYIDSVLWTNKNGDLVKIKQFNPDISAQYTPLNGEHPTANPIVPGNVILATPESEQDGKNHVVAASTQHISTAKTL
mmetsp:Transcript_1294/g.1664  ORF Transcript_1294/g.1664 Transcript_1294/m.1664 type:complete len:218 (+) Transcript_1294:135-788(+)|eukprot:CAMPEP_0197288248 /NCGR_PEP_ID=MMETSP0890-20130614/5260_1 /TAXON_ID=44058 ORGANISM="Aureoumbra lagunensis, Strain CCMP1510" /NCGR_SAMPLE_ID=MMETSP0890 /ASSEMBLY_ACC=CAM_ASM_000533 /LENGTH=217 /DNA_ID=CAMNT_0042758817 /DNA_START=135 /DNA_END=788 /DNA_ORIENTATION=-